MPSSVRGGSDVDRHAILRAVGLDAACLSEGDLLARSPVDGAVIAQLAPTSPREVDAALARAAGTFARWRSVPAPRRGELVRLFGEQLRVHQDALAALVTLETGKILAEARGEVQEMIDVCDFAVGLSRQLYGRTIASERPGHRMMETWHPLGVVGVISAFNFPVAVWSWNAAVALVCGDPVVWKPSEKAPLCALACQSIFERALSAYRTTSGGEEWSRAVHRAARRAGDRPGGGGGPPGGAGVRDRLGADGSGGRPGRRRASGAGPARVGRQQRRDRGIVGRSRPRGPGHSVRRRRHRGPTLRWLIVHESVADELVGALRQRYDSLPIGDPFDPATLVCPLIDEAALDGMAKALVAAQADGGVVHGGGRVLAEERPEACYARPAIVEMPAQTEIVRHETFAPILYVLRYTDFDQAIYLHNDVPQGLSSGIFTNDLREAERFLSATGSDCGIANVNIGPSGAEVGGAFGGEKDTGGGRESGSDAWRSYMRRSTATINYSTKPPLAQGIEFDQRDPA